MGRLLFTALACLLTITCSCQLVNDTVSDSKHNNISIELPSLFFTEFNLGYERAINQNLRIKVSFPYLRRDMSKMILTNLALNSIYSDEDENIDVEEAIEDLDGLAILKMKGISFQVLYFINPTKTGFFLSPQYTYRNVDSELELDQSDLNQLANTGIISSYDSFYEVDLEFSLSFLGFCIGHRWESNGWCFDSLIGVGKYFGEYEIEDSEGEFEIKDDFEIYLPKVGLTLGYAF
jgi:hypothetical protein